MNTDSLKVDLDDRSYDIKIGTDLLGDFAQHANQAFDTQVENWVIISDAAVSEIHARRVADSLAAANARILHRKVPSGELSKSFCQLTEILEWMSESKVDRKSVVVAVGGGVVGDLAGFVAASYARGIRFVQVPTTLLAQVDSSVGGKTGINLSKAKNMVGAFWQPSLVIIDLNTLETLPRREYISGLAEVVKYGVIADEHFFDQLDRDSAAILDRSSAELRGAIYRSCEIKSEVVRDDERETTGRRVILNYGHTFAHALEAASNYGRLLHGEAVAIGMSMAGRLALELGMWTEREMDAQRKLLQKFGLPCSCDDVDANDLLLDGGIDRIIGLMQTDKKVEYGQLHFVLPTRIGHVERRSRIGEMLVRTAIIG